MAARSMRASIAEWDPPEETLAIGAAKLFGQVPEYLMSRLGGKTALVTGGSSGIGLATRDSSSARAPTFTLPDGAKLTYARGVRRPSNVGHQSNPLAPPGRRLADVAPRFSEMRNPLRGGRWARAIGADDDVMLRPPRRRRALGSGHGIGGHFSPFRRSSAHFATRTSAFPKLLPSSMSMKAAGAFSSPSVMSSR